MKRGLKIGMSMFGAICVFAALVYAIPQLLTETEVDTCFDFDGGVNINTSSSVFTVTNGTFAPYYDTCISGNTTLIEYACGTSGNITTVQVWSENCTCANGACVI